MPSRSRSRPGSPESFPTSIPPMLAADGDAPFVEEGWAFEPKLDGYRIQGWKHAGNLRLVTRGAQDVSDVFPAIVAALKSQPARSLIVDAELVAFDKGGTPSFSELQAWTKNRHSKRGTAVLFCFDLLHVDGCNTRDLPQVQRRAILEDVLKPSAAIQLVHAVDDGIALFSAAVDNGMEGIIAKRKDSVYQPGIRSADWLKILAFKRADLLILGYTGSAKVESLLVGYRRAGQLKYAAKVAGLGKLASTLPPLLKAVPDADPLESIEGARWIAPMLVAEIRYREITRDGKLRHPVFYRMRDDIAPAQPDFPEFLPR